MRYIRDVNAQPNAPPRGWAGCIVAVLGGLEIVRGHAVEELLELLHFVLPHGGAALLVALVGNEQPGLGEHGLLDVDRNADPQRYRHRVRRARRYRDVAVED